MNLIEMVTGNIVSTVIGGVATFAIWQMTKIVWEYFKPLEEVTKFCQKKSYAFGRNTRQFLTLRVSDPAFRETLFQEMERDSEKVQDAFVRGIRGELF